MSKVKPNATIHVGTMFASPSGDRWVVFTDRSFGKLQMVTATRQKTCDCTKADLRRWCQKDGWIRLKETARSGFLDCSEARP